MKDYIRLEILASGDSVDQYLSKGWEIIDTTKSAFPEGDTFVKYHLGLPSKVLMDNLLSIIKEYERHGLKELLFESIAKQNDDNVNDYDTNGFHSTKNELTNFMQTYEDVVNNKKVTYSNRKESPFNNDKDYNF